MIYLRTGNVAGDVPIGEDAQQPVVVPAGVVYDAARGLKAAALSQPLPYASGLLPRGVEAVGTMEDCGLVRMAEPGYQQRNLQATACQHLLFRRLRQREQQRPLPFICSRRDWSPGLQNARRQDDGAGTSAGRCWRPRLHWGLCTGLFCALNILAAPAHLQVVAARQKRGPQAGVDRGARHPWDGSCRHHRDLTTRLPQAAVAALPSRPRWPLLGLHNACMLCRAQNLFLSGCIRVGKQCPGPASEHHRHPNQGLPGLVLQQHRVRVLLHGTAWGAALRSFGLNQS